MSRIGKLPISIPENVKVELQGQLVKISGPKGSLEWKIPENLSLKIGEGNLFVENNRKDEKTKTMHGTTRSLVSNMVTGVSSGWTKQLELVGTGYRAEVSGDSLVLSVGYSHPIKINASKDVSFKVEKTNITVEGPDKELVGLTAARIRAVRPPEPYKGKGIKYKNEVIRRKAGKAAKTAGPA